MPFRDDREALLRRAESLEQELASERQGRAASEAERARLATELRAVHEALRHVRSPEPGARRARPATMIGAGLGIATSLTVAVAVVLLGRRDVEPPPPPAFSAPVVATPPPAFSAPVAETPQPPPTPLRVSSALSAAELRAVLRREQRSARQCYERTVRGRREALELRVTLRVTIGAKGNVEAVQPRVWGRMGAHEPPAPGSDELTLTNCLRAAVLIWQFPASSGPTFAEIPFVFTAGD